MKVISYLNSLSIVLLTSSCSISPSKSGRESFSEANVSSFSRLTKDDLVVELFNRTTELNLQKNELVKLNLINEALCENINTINTNCLVKKPITSNAKVSLVSCNGNAAVQVSNSKIEVKISSNTTGQFSLVFHSDNSIYESDFFANGLQDLTFSNLVDDAVITPTFADIEKMSLKVETLKVDSELPPAVTVDILIDGQTVLIDTLSQVAAGGSYEINVKSIYQHLISPTCQMSNEDLDELLEPFKDSGVPFDNDEHFSDTEQERYEEERDVIEQQITDVQDELTELEPILLSARNRSFKLRQAVTGGSGVGCHLKQKIETLSITIDGTPIIDHVHSKRDDKIEGFGNAKELEIDLGGVSFSSTAAIGATIIPDEDLSSFNIHSISKVSLKKGGVSYINNLIKCKGGFFGSLKLDNDCYEIKEESVMDINKITLEVNGLTLFEKGNLGLKLFRDRMSWSFENLHQSPKWSEMLLRNDCEVTE